MGHAAPPGALLHCNFSIYEPLGLHIHGSSARQQLDAYVYGFSRRVTRIIFHPVHVHCNFSVYSEITRSRLLEKEGFKQICSGKWTLYTIPRAQVFRRHCTAILVSTRKWMGESSTDKDLKQLSSMFSASAIHTFSALQFQSPCRNTQVETPGGGRIQSNMHLEVDIVHALRVPSSQCCKNAL